MSDFENKDYYQNNTNSGNSNGPQQNNWNSYNQSSGAWQPQQQIPPYGYQQQQQSPYRQNQDAYKWNFKEYDSMSPKKPPHGKKSGVKVFLTIVAVLISISVIGFAGFGVYSLTAGGELLNGKGAASQAASSAAPQGNTASTAATSSASGLNIADVPGSANNEIVSVGGVLTTKQIYAKVAPSVVGIVNYQKDGGWVASGEGSGIVMSADGYIVTNAHVVNGAQGIKVVLNTNKEYEAKLIGSDTKTDLAVIKIDATGLTPAAFGNSEQMVTGDKVVAIGNPGGLEFAGSITQGIISAVNRPLQSSTGYTMNCIQTDAAINPGNSGGPLVNEFGQVVGINSSKIAATEYEGIGFAIPMNTAKPIIDDLIKNGRVTGRAKIGISIEGEVTEMSAQLYSIPTGILIAGVDKGSDIAAKGVRANDIITKIDGSKVDTVNQVFDILAKHKPGDSVTLTVFRRPTNAADQTFEVAVVLGEDTGTTAAQELPSTQEGLPKAE